MRIFGISDLHLAHCVDKPMDIFGEHWRDHTVKMATRWDQRVGEQDLVLCPGDLSWAMNLEQASPDLDWIHQRPGFKILLRGNHDYWWKAISKVRAALPASCHALQNDSLVHAGVALAGTRLWNHPDSADAKTGDEKIWARELGRLEISLRSLPPADAGGHLRVALVHYPPCGPGGVASPATELLSHFAIDLCVYGHLHGHVSHGQAFEGELDGVSYRCISCDFIDFSPIELATVSESHVK